MTVDPRIVEIDEDPELTASQRLNAQLTWILDRTMAEFWADPQKTDAMLRRDGMVKTADRLGEVLGPEW